MPDPAGGLPHLLVLGRVDDKPLQRRGGGGNPKIRPVERRAHGRTILGEAQEAFEQADDHRALFARDELEALGTFITLFGDQAVYPLKVESLEQRTRHRTSPKLPKWLLMSVHPATDDEPERAVVWVADSYRGAFLKLFQDYLDDAKVSTRAQRERWVTSEGNPRNVELVANIAVIRATVLRDLWQSTGEPPTSGTQWWEVWLEPTDDGLALLRRFAAAYGLTLLERTLRLGNRVVAWINATWAELELLPFTAVPLAEVRRPQFVDTFEDLSVQEQDEYVVELAGRVSAAPSG
ncbi:MAG TPA: subtilisin family serine protease, partial [Coriobacteriia bacterium]|nr:subtilisin family serine protease [Coriobacteriia bacterium]